jgi:hypothetical protein
MDANLKGIKPRRDQPYVKKQFQPAVDLYLIDITTINSNGFHLSIYRPDNEVFSTSLYEIDRILEDREEEEADVDSASAEGPRMPAAYSEYKDVGSKAASDVLPPHWTYNHKITLNKPNMLGYSPLYQMSVTELEEVKHYLLDNLNKGFIEPSQSPFTVLVLFVKKANGSLRFCIDYWKLNQLTRKDRYPIPLLDETLARLGRAKVFTKLDIRQAFHCIRMDPDSEELTTFCTRYRAYKYKVLPFGLTNGLATY